MYWTSLLSGARHFTNCRCCLYKVFTGLFHLLSLTWIALLRLNKVPMMNCANSSSKPMIIPASRFLLLQGVAKYSLLFWSVFLYHKFWSSSLLVCSLGIWIKKKWAMEYFFLEVRLLCWLSNVDLILLVLFHQKLDY